MAIGTGSSSFDRFLNEPFLPKVGDAADRAISGLGRSASTLGNAMMAPIFAAREAVGGGAIIRTGYGQSPNERPEFRNPAEQWDARPVAPRTAAGVAPQPAAPSLAAASVPQFPATGMGLMGNQNVRPLPTDQISPMTRMAPTLADHGGVTTDITGMQGKTPIQTPYGTVYATAQQAGTERVAEMGGLPAQSARLANIGERARATGIARLGGEQIAKGYTETMQRFSQSRIPQGMRSSEMAAPQGRMGQPLMENFPRSREAMAQARQIISPASPMASFAPIQSPSPFIENGIRNPFSSIYGFQS